MAANRCMKHTMNDFVSVISISSPIEKPVISIRKSVDELLYILNF